MAGIERGARWGRLALVMGALGLLLAGCGHTFPGANTAPPSGWTDITPPDSGQSAQYAVSPDIPGLIVALIGGRAQASADPPPDARLWRSQDGGATWQSLDSLTPRSGSYLFMPSGGHGLVISLDTLETSVSVSRDEGSTWRTKPLNLPNNEPGMEEVNLLYGAVSVGGRLYSGGGGHLSASDDGGLTWRTNETGPDPLNASMGTAAIAPLDASGSSWLRLASQSNGAVAQSAIERSDDGGATWRVVTQQLPVASGPVFSAQFAASAAHRGRVCLAMTVEDSNPNVAAAPTVTPASTAPPQPTVSPGKRGDVSYPPPQEKDVALLASDDGGQTWHGGVVEALRRRYGDIVQPDVGMSADGSCYLATSQASNPFGVGAYTLATLWRLAPGATQPQAQWAMAGRGLLYLALAPGGPGSTERIIALTRIAGPGDGDAESCGPGCMTLHDGGGYRLIWQPLSPRG